MPASRTQIDRAVLKDQDVMIASGDFAPLFRAWHEHTLRWELPVDGLGEVMMHQALAGAALQLSYRVPEESTAWTLNFPRPAANVFVTGGGIHHTIAGRYYAEGVKEVGHGRLFVQRSHPHHEVQSSALEFEGLDVLEVFEKFFRDSEQIAARFFEHSDAGFSMILGLPGADPEWVAALAADDVAGLRERATPLDRREFGFRCGCNPDQVAGTLARMFASQADEFFAGEPVVEALCPRCGARHLLDRKTFDRIVEGL